MGAKNFIQKKFNEYKRILLISRKPTKEEYLNVVKISAIGIGLIGLMGFVIQFVAQAII